MGATGSLDSIACVIAVEEAAVVLSGSLYTLEVVGATGSTDSTDSVGSFGAELVKLDGTAGDSAAAVSLLVLKVATVVAPAVSEVGASYSAAVDEGEGTMEVSCVAEVSAAALVVTWDVLAAMSVSAAAVSSYCAAESAAVELVGVTCSESDALVAAFVASAAGSSATMLDGDTAAAVLEVASAVVALVSDVASSGDSAVAADDVAAGATGTPETAVVDCAPFPFPLASAACIWTLA